MTEIPNILPASPDQQTPANVAAWLQNFTDGDEVQGNEDGEIQVVIGLRDRSVAPAQYVYVTFPELPDKSEDDLLDELTKEASGMLTVEGSLTPVKLNVETGVDVDALQSLAPEGMRNHYYTPWNSLLSAADQRFVDASPEDKAAIVDNMTGRELREFIGRIDDTFRQMGEIKPALIDAKNTLKGVVYSSYVPEGN